MHSHSIEFREMCSTCKKAACVDNDHDDDDDDELMTNDAFPFVEKFPNSHRMRLNLSIKVITFQLTLSR